MLQDTAVTGSIGTTVTANTALGLQAALASATAKTATNTIVTTATAGMTLTADITIAAGDTLSVADAAKITTAKKITLEGTLTQASAKNVILKEGATVAVKAATAKFTNAKSGVFSNADSDKSVTITDTTAKQSVVVTSAGTPTNYGTATALDGENAGTDNGVVITLSIDNGVLKMLCADS